MTEERIQAVLDEAEDDIASARAMLLEAREGTSVRNARLRGASAILELVALSLRRLANGE